MSNRRPLRAATATARLSASTSAPTPRRSTPATRPGRPGSPSAGSSDAPGSGDGRLDADAGATRSCSRRRTSPLTRRGAKATMRNSARNKGGKCRASVSNPRIDVTLASMLERWGVGVVRAFPAGRSLILGLLLAMVAACSSDPPSRISLFSVPGGPTPPSEFYELPWPNDLRRTADGRLDLHDYPRVNVTVDRFTDALGGTDIDGFGLNAAMFVRFGGPID